MVNPVEITVSVIAKPVGKINQKIIMLNNSQKIDALKEIVQSRAGARLLIFTKTKHGAEKVVQSLKKDGFMVASIHGNKSQNQRQKSLINFKNGSCPLLVATDIAARGIDIPGVEAVIIMFAGQAMSIELAAQLGQDGRCNIILLRAGNKKTQSN